jgi:hypothetical protein
VEFGRIESIEIGQNLGSGEDVRLAQVNVVGEDTVTVELPFPEGDEFVPAVGDTVYYEEVDAGLLVARCIQSALPVDSGLGTGEREMFSRDGDERKAKIRLKNDGTVLINSDVVVLESGGTITINGGTDFAVKFQALQTGLDNMMTMLNTYLNLVKGHKHTAFGTPSEELLPVVAPTLDISAAKVDKVKL